MEPIRLSDRMRDRWVSHHFRQRLVGVLGIVEDLVYVMLAVGLVAGVLDIVCATLIHLGGRSPSILISTVLDRFLFVLMLAELLHTLLLFLKTHEFRPQPVLVVGIITAVRQMVVATAQAAVTGPEGHLSRYLLGLGVTSLVTLALSLALRWTSAPQADARPEGLAPLEILFAQGRQQPRGVQEQVQSVVNVTDDDIRRQHGDPRGTLRANHGNG